MDLAIVTGRGPELLTNINSLKPYVEDENVIHIGQRDQEETEKYNSQDIRQSEIKCFSYFDIKVKGIKSVTYDLLTHLNKLNVDRFWIHFDTDVLDDKINPAVDYRLPGGISFQEAEFLLRELLKTNKISGLSISIFNPKLDLDRSISKSIAKIISNAFSNEVK
jgi:arginase